MTIKRDLLEAEVQQIKGTNEVVSAEDILRWAETHRSSAWAAELTWDDKIAGREHRLNQIRQVIITLQIKIGEQVRKYYSLSIDRNRKGGGYRDITEILDSDSLTEILLRDALAELERLQEKYETLKALRPIWLAMRKVKSKTGPKPKGGKRRKTSRGGTARKAKSRKAGSASQRLAKPRKA